MGAAEPGLVLVDPTQIEQVLVNLVQNALDVTPEGGLVEVGVVINDGMITLSVEDEGPGVPESDRKRIFEPFVTTKEQGIGTGLGLAISHRIATDHGGTLSVSAAPTGGARFEFRIQMAEVQHQQH